MFGGAFGGGGDEDQGEEYGDEEENEMENALQIGNIYKFNQNRNYYDSLESIEILRNQPPEYIEGGLSRQQSGDSNLDDSVQRMDGDSVQRIR